MLIRLLYPLPRRSLDHALGSITRPAAPPRRNLEEVHGGSLDLHDDLRRFRRRVSDLLQLRGLLRGAGSHHSTTSGRMVSWRTRPLGEGAGSDRKSVV